MLTSDTELLEMEIEMLKMQIQQQKIREDHLNKINQALSEQLNEFSSMVEERNRLFVNNQMLEKKVHAMEERHEKEVRYYDMEINKLKDQLHEKINEMQRMRIEADKQKFKMEQKIKLMEGMVEKKCSSIAELEKTIHDLNIANYKESGKTSRITSLPTANSHELASSVMRNTYNFSHNQSFSNTQNNMQLSNLKLQNSRPFSKRESLNSKQEPGSSRKQKSKKCDYDKDLVQMSKEQMGIMMKSLIRSKRQIEKGNSEISMLSQISTLTANNPKRNRTMMAQYKY